MGGTFVAESSVSTCDESRTEVVSTWCVPSEQTQSFNWLQEQFGQSCQEEEVQTESIPLSGDQSVPESELKKGRRHGSIFKRMKVKKKRRDVKGKVSIATMTGSVKSSQVQISLIFRRRERLDGYVHVQKPGARV